MTVDEFRALFQSFQKSAFRYEALPEYEMSDEDRDAVARWKSGDAEPASISGTSWQQNVKKWTAAGKTMQRVRVLKKPFTDYLRMSVEWWYPYNIAAGEETTGLDPDSYSSPLPPQDFWLFDDKTVVLMNYDSNGHFTGVQDVTNVDDVIEYVNWKSDLLSAAGDLRQTYDHLLADV